MERQRGQATVELLGVVPALLVAVLIVWQLALAGHTAWLAAGAARAAARAQLVGGDARAAARSALPGALERGLEVEQTPSGAMRLRVPIPFLHHTWAGPVKVSASASLEAER